MAGDDRSLAARVLVISALVALVAALAGVLVFHPHVPLMLFLAVLGALLLDGAAAPLHRRLHVPRRLAICVVALVFLGLVGGAVWLWGPTAASQASEVVSRLPSALNRVERFLSEHGWSEEALADGWDVQRLRDVLSTVWAPLTGAAATAFAAASGGVVVAFVAFLLALDPRPYVDGLARLAKPRARPRFHEVLGDIDRALRWWLVGRLASMAVVGGMTVAGLFLIGAPHAPLLGLLAGALSFVPYLGPVLAAVPAVLVGLAEDPGLALWIGVLYFGIQLVESNLITPLIQVRAVSLPPAALLAAQLFMGVLFGLLGVLVATPVTVAAIVAVQTLYVQDVLGERIEVLGDHGKDRRRSAG